MRIPSKSAVAGLSLSLMAGTAGAADVCARAPDLVALQVAALQQQLMVAALTCDDVSLYNNFVRIYQKELLASDVALQAFFDRFGEEDGAPAYHSFKTKMANIYSSRSAADKKRFCESARASFGPVLKAEKMSLASFAMSQPSTVNEPYTSCGQSVAGGAMVSGAPAAGAPLRNLLTAQNAAGAAAATGAAAAAVTSGTDKPLGVAANVESSGKTLEPAAAAPSAGSAAVAAAGANTPPRSQAANPNLNQERSAPNAAPNRFGYANQRAQAYWRERERLAQERAAAQRAAQQQRLRYRDPYYGRGYFWPADPYWQDCYTRYGVRMSCAEAAQRFRSNRYYYRAPYDSGGYRLR